MFIKTRKCLFIGLYNSPAQNENKMTIENKNLEDFMNSFVLQCLIKKPTCFQSKNPSCIDLILTNKKDLFKSSNVLEAGSSDHHSLIITALKR